MAGTCRPYCPEERLKTEATYKVLSLKAQDTSGGTIDNCGLFNGITADEWNTANVFYWYSSSNYLEIEITSNLVNIWRSGTSTWVNYTGTLFIYKLINGAYVDITNTITQTTTPINHLHWEKTISNLTKGTYKFVGGNGYRLDSEWYIEDCNGDLINPICTDLSSIKLGDLYPCKYISKTSSSVGSFSDLGSESEFISIDGSNTPNGCFYWVYIGNDKYNRKQFIADRNIQHTIPWQYLSDNGLITGNTDLFNIGLSYASSNTKLNIVDNTVSSTNTVWQQARCNICKSSGVWYYEVLVNTCTSNELGIGFCTDNALLEGYQNDTLYMYLCDGTLWTGTDNEFISYGKSYVAGDIIGVLLDFDNNEIHFYRNGVDQGVAFTNIKGLDLYPCIELYGTVSATLHLNDIDFVYSISNAFPYTYNDLTQIYEYTVTLPNCLTWNKYLDYIHAYTNISSLTQDMLVDNTSYRVIKGGETVNKTSSISANTSSSSIGFRPVLTIGTKLSANLKLNSNCSYLQPLYLTGSFTDNVMYTIKLNENILVSSVKINKGEQVYMPFEITEDGVITIYYSNDIQEKFTTFNVYKKNYPITYVDYNQPSKNFSENLVKISPTTIVLCKYTYNRNYGYLYTAIMKLGFLALNNNTGTLIFGLIKESFNISKVTYNSLPKLDQDTYTVTVDLQSDLQVELTALMKKLLYNDYFGVYVKTENITETLSSNRNSIQIDYIPTLLEQPKLVYNSKCLITWKEVIYSRMNSIDRLELWKDRNSDFSSASKILECDINTTSHLDTNLSYGTTYYKLIVKMKEQSSSGEIKFEDSNDYIYNNVIINSNTVSLEVISESHSYNISFSDTDINDKVTLLNSDISEIANGVFKFKHA